MPNDLVDVRGLELVFDENGKLKSRKEHYRPWLRARELAELTLSRDFDYLSMIVGINPRASKSGREEAVSRRFNIGVDIDIPDLEPDDVLAMIEAAGYPPPTVLVFSGRGYHVWWRLTRSVSKQQWERIQGTATRDLKGDSSVCNPAHCLRLAGTVNPKHGIRTVLVVCEASRRYSPESFPGFASDLDPPPRETPSALSAPSAGSVPSLLSPPTGTADAADGVSEEAEIEAMTDEQRKALVAIFGVREITAFGTSDKVIHDLARLIKRQLQLHDRPAWLEPALIICFNEHAEHMRRDWLEFWGAFCRAWDSLGDAKPGSLGEAVADARSLPIHPSLADLYPEGSPAPTKRVVTLFNVFVILQRRQPDRSIFVSQLDLASELGYMDHSSIGQPIRDVFRRHGLIERTAEHQYARVGGKKPRAAEYRVLVDLYPPEWETQK